MRGNRMNAPGGPECACGRPSRLESGHCGVLSAIVCMTATCPACGSGDVRVYPETRVRPETADDHDGWRCNACLHRFDEAEAA